MPYRERLQPEKRSEEEIKEDYLKERGVERDEQGRLILYHVTTAENYAKIQRDSLLKPRSTTGERVWGVKGEETDVEKSNKIYLAAGKTAKDIASMIQRERGGSIYILEVHVDEKSLFPDEDSGANRWYESLGWLGTCAYKGEIVDYKLKTKINFELPKATKLDFFERAASLEEGSKEYEKLYQEYKNLVKTEEQKEKTMMQKILAEKSDTDLKNKDS